MNIDIETISTNRSKLHYTITAEEYQSVLDDVTVKYVNKSTLPGFRKGKAPRSLVLKQYRKDIEEDATSSAVSRFYEQSLEGENAPKAYELLGVTDVKHTDEGGLCFSAEVDLAPEFELPELEGIPVDNQDTKVGIADIRGEIARLRKQFAKLVDFEPGQEAAADDMMAISYTAKVGGKPMLEVYPDAAMIAERPMSWCTVGSEHYMIPGIAKALQRKKVKVGDEIVVHVVFPEDYAREDLRGVKADYTVTVKSGQHLVEPEMGEAFFKQVGCNSEDELKSMVRTRLEMAAQRKDRNRRTEQVVNYLLKDMNFELPAADLERRETVIIRDLVSRGMQQGASKEAMEAEREKFMATAHEEAVKDFRLYLILRAAARKLEMTLSREEFTSFLTIYCQVNRMTQTDFDRMAKDRMQMYKLQSIAINQKVLDTLLNKATPTESLNAQ